MKGFILAIAAICCLGFLMTDEAHATHGGLFLRRAPVVQRQVVRQQFVRQPVVHRQRIVQQFVQPYAVQQVVAAPVVQQYVAPQAVVVPQQYVAPQQIVVPQAVQSGCSNQGNCPNVF